ncbi:MAG: hypothetical protein PVG03_15790 [Desulfarculaceae bacterium]|jgi:hypothetical protein
MTKIDQIQPGQNGQAQKSGKSAKPQQGPSFQEVLDKAGQAGQPKAQATGSVSPPPATGLVTPPSATAPVSQTLSPLQSQGLEHAERTMELLEAYVDRLGDEGRPLKDVASLVESMEKELVKLNQVLAELDPSDELFGILDEIGSLAAVETIKFNRGDHVPSF